MAGKQSMLNMLLENVVSRENISAQGDVSLKEVISLMNNNQKGVVVLLEGNRPAGILTERDIVEILYRDVSLLDKARNHANRRLISTRSSRTVGYALNLTLENNIRRIVVKDDSGQLYGITTQQDLLKYLEEDFYRQPVKVKHILTRSRELISVQTEDALHDVLHKMVTHKISSVAVLSDGKPVGILSENDMLRLAESDVSFDDAAGNHMTGPVEIISLDTPLTEVVEVMNKKNTRGMVVVNENEEALTMVTIRDVVGNLEGDYSRFIERKFRNARAVLNMLPEMFLEVTDTGVEQLIVWANDNVLSRFGDDILDRNVNSFIPQENWDMIYSTLNKLHKIENIKLKKDDRIYELSGFYSGAENGTEQGSYHLIMRDITEDVSLTTIDTLTRIYNKRFINEFLMKEIERSRRSNKQFSLVICDVDDFKHINDTYGHGSGDMVLKSFSRITSETIRNLDVVGRYGGDEFMIILPDASGDIAYNIIDRLRLNIEDHETAVNKGNKVRITASFGIATFPDDGMSSADLLITGDKRLYKAKCFGKNKIACS